VVGRYADGWKVRVGAPPEGGRANEAVVRLLAGVLSLPRPAVRVVSGHAARDKIVEVAGIAPAQTERRLATAARSAHVRKDSRT
jgi:uncharacterized protein YggU (UPF0235/DUF167 family)